MRATWEAIQDKIKAQIPKQAFALWINPITYLESRDHTLVLGCPNRFSRDWVAENYLGLIRRQLGDLGNGLSDVRLKVHRTAGDGLSACELDPPAQMSFPNFPQTRAPFRMLFNDAYTFDRFVVGQSNEFAFSASKAFSREHHPDYQTLMMLSTTGLGKTHLSQAVGSAILEQSPDCRVLYMTAEDFTNEMIAALKSKSIERFKEKYRRGCDVLLLEEVHFLSGKEKTQVELGHTLDALANAKKKVIFTSALPPQEIPRMSTDLCSRLTAGLVTTIEKPDLDTRLKIITSKASEFGLRLPEEVIQLLADRLQGDVRRIESALKCLKAKSELLHAKINADLARGVLACLTPPEQTITLHKVAAIVCKYYKVDPESLRSKSRKKIHALPRNMYIYLCRRYTEETLEAIAQSVNRSHSTALYAAETVRRKIKTDPLLRKQVTLLTRELEGK